MSAGPDAPKGFVCPVCGAQLQIPPDHHVQEVRCNTCGTFVACPAAEPQAAAAPLVRLASNAELARLRLKWRILIGLLVLPLLVLAPFSLRVGATGSAQALRLCTMNLLLAALYGYGLMAGGYDPVVISRIVRLDLDRRQIVALFLPAFIIALFLGYYTYSP